MEQKPIDRGFVFVAMLNGECRNCRHHTELNPAGRCIRCAKREHEARHDA